MHADEAAGIPAGGAGFGAEAGRGGRVAPREILLIQNLTRVQIGERHFRGGDEVVILLAQPEEVLLELGKLARAGHGGAVDDEGRGHFDVALFLVLIEEEIDEGALELGSPAEGDDEAAAGLAHGALEVKAAEIRAEIPVGLRLEVKGRRGSPAADLHVLGLVLSHGHGGVGDVGHAHHPVRHSLPRFLGLCVKSLDAVGEPAELGDARGGVLSLALQQGHFLGGLIALAFERLDLGDESAALPVELLEILYGKFGVAHLQVAFQYFRLFLYKLEI